MVRILFAVTISSTANAFLKQQISTLVAEGWDVHLTCNPDSSIDELAQIEGLSLHPIPMKRNPSPLKDLVSLYRLYRTIKNVEPDIVVGSTPKAGLLSMIAARWNDIPARTYHIRGFRAEGLSGVQRFISIVSEKQTIIRATQVLCDSVSLKKALVASRCLDQSIGIVVGSGSCCGVDTEFFRPPTAAEKSHARERMGLNLGDVVVGFAGRITRDKGVGELTEAVSSVNQTYGEVRLVLVGPDEGGIDYLGDLLSNDAIIYSGPTTDVRSAYWAFDIFALPSHREGFPISPLEAQACGLPLITTTATGCVDSQPPQNSRLSVPPKDSESIAAAIEHLIANPDERSAMGVSARLWVQENFNSTDVVQRQIDFLKSQVSISINEP